MLPETRINLAAYFTARPLRTVNIHISFSGAEGADQLVKFSRCYALSGWANDIGGPECARDGRGRRRTGLRASRPITEIRTEKDGNTTVDTHLSDVYVCLLDRSFEVRIA